MITPWWPAAAGLPAGICAGLFGIGGGFLLMPVLAGAGYPYASAVATVAVPVLLSAILSLIRRRHVRPVPGPALCAVLGSLPGARIGAYISQVADVDGVRILFSLYVALLLYLSYGLLRPARPIAPGAADRSPLWAALLGLPAGLCSGLFGVGGAFLLIPGFMRFYGMPVDRAGATAQVQIVFASALSIYSHAGHHDVDRLQAALLSGTVLTGVLIGVRAAEHLPVAKLRRGLGGLMVAVALATAYDQLIAR